MRGMGRLASEYGTCKSNAEESSVALEISVAGGG